MAADQNFTLYRLYGDFSGTGAVTGADFTQLVTVIGKATNASDWYVDFDGDGVISGSDFTQFVSRLGHSLSIPALPSVVVLGAAVPATNATSSATNTMTSTLNVTTGSSAVPAAPVTHQISNKKVQHRHGR
jgi:hypothetical protein